MIKPLRVSLITMTAVTLLCAVFPANSLPSLVNQLGYENHATKSIHSHILNEERRIRVYLPITYESSQKYYPVLYVLDAESERQINGCISTVEHLRKKEGGPEMIIVGIWNTNRNRDMIPESVPHRPGSGGSSRFLDFIRKELIPFVEDNYRASETSLLYGASNAGLFTVYASLVSPESFDVYVASSPMIGHCPDLIQDKREAFLNRQYQAPRVLFMIYGTKDSPRVTDFVPEFYRTMKARSPKNFLIELEILEGEGHVPASSLHRGLVFAMENSDRLRPVK